MDNQSTITHPPSRADWSQFKAELTSRGRSDFSTNGVYQNQDEGNPPRGPLHNQNRYVQTRYMRMLLQLDDIPTLHNVLAGFFSWILLAGYIVFPGTFTSLRNSNSLDKSKPGMVVQETVKNVPLLWVAALCCITGSFGMCWLWWTWQENFIWLVRQIFL